MNLKSIKLVGFKSFVDPTLIPITGHLTGIVGPNGCGKSNVVDAIRWVIGETSAKQLRGQSMADVIFNGAAGRKPLGMAAVELVFDNSDGRIGGEYAKFGEISIRREVHREGQSQYFLNGVNCRRRDIVDVFLGTGLGSRSYAIIEQGVISELIEAKPEELRVHLEEVSGISKYKERRRETETRMRHTHENLERLQDVNDELTKQARHLQRQAEAAEKYTELKQQERRLQAEIKLLQWQSLQQQLGEQDAALTQWQVQQDESMADLRALEADIEKRRVEQLDMNTQRDAVQKSFYELGAQVARLEQRIAHSREQVQHWRKELSEVENLSAELIEHRTEQQENTEKLQVELTELTPQSAAAKTAAQTAGEHWQALEQRMQQWRRRWEAFQTEFSQITAQTGVIKTNLQHYEQQLSHLQVRQAQLLERQSQLPVVELSAEISPLSNQVAYLREKITGLQSTLDALAESIRRHREQNATLQQQLEQSRRQMHALQQRHASLEAVQQTALGYHDDHTKTWLNAQGIMESPRLGQILQVNPGWELAVETVLGGYFDAVCLQNFADVVTAVTQINAGRLTLIDNHSATQSSAPKSELTLLSSQINTAAPVHEWLTGVYLAEDLPQALMIQPQLQDHESVITRDGVWLGKHWVRINKAVTPDSGVLKREQELKQLIQEMEILRQQAQQLQQHIQHNDAALRDLEEQRDAQHREYQNHQRQADRSASRAQCAAEPVNRIAAAATAITARNRRV